MEQDSVIYLVGDKPKELTPVVLSSPHSTKSEHSAHSADSDSGDDQSDADTVVNFAPEQAVANLPQPTVIPPTYIEAKNRRKRYLEVHPEYFDDPLLELADPLFYDRVIRRFQTAAEREADGRRKFTNDRSEYFIRAEAKRNALDRPNPYALYSAYERGPDGEILSEDEDDIPESREEGRARWVDEMTQRFLRGDDDAFDYTTVDANEDYNHPEQERDREMAYYDDLGSEFDEEESNMSCPKHVPTDEFGNRDYDY